MSQEGWGLQTRAKANFSGRRQQPKMKKSFFIKRNRGNHSVQQDEVPEIITIITTGCAY